MTEDNLEDEAFIHDQMTDRKMLIGKVDGMFEFVAQRSERRKKLEKPTVCVKAKSDTVNIDFASDTTDSEPSFDDDNFEIPQEKTSEQILIMPKDILSKTARTAIGMGISRHQANSLITSVVGQSGGDIDKITLYKTSRQRISDKIIHQDAAVVRANLKKKVMEADMPIIVHFDGKIIKDYTGSTDETKDRLCILMKHEGETHLLDVPGLAHGIGEAQFEAIQKLYDSYDIVNMWNIF